MAFADQPKQPLDSSILLSILLVGVCVMGCRNESTRAPDRARAQGPALYRDVTSESGIDFQHQVASDGRYFFPEIMGPGAAFLDFDQDGKLDCYLINSGALQQVDNPPADVPANRLYRQQQDGRFIDVTSKAGLDDRGFGMGVAIGDINNDGYPDVYVTNYGPDRLYLNQRDGTFVDVSAKAGIDNDRWSASACFLDYDRDGWLDLFVTNYVDYQPYQPCYDAGGRLDYCNPALFPGTADKLYRNQSAEMVDPAPDARDVDDVKFTDVSVPTGVADKAGAGLGVVSGDFNGDLWPDLYVANDGHANFAWVNQRDGTFREEAVLLGVAYDALGRGQGSMGIAVADINADSNLDLLVTHLEGESNALYATGATAGFQELSRDFGLADMSFPLTGFGVAFLDIEHDGDMDLAVANGRVRRSPLPKSSRLQSGERDSASAASDKENIWTAYTEPNQLFTNLGKGRFELVDLTNDPFDRPHEISRALVYGDVDNDGDLDLLVTNVAGPTRLYHNESQKQGHWLSVRAIVKEWGGRDAYGARITVVAAERHWTRLANPGSSYLSSHDPRVHFGIGSASRFDRMDVIWPDGTKETFAGGEADRHVVLTRGEGSPVEQGAAR